MYDARALASVLLDAHGRAAVGHSAAAGSRWRPSNSGPSMLWPAWTGPRRSRATSGAGDWTPVLSAELGAVVVHLAELVAGEVREHEAAAMAPSACSSNRRRVEVNARDLRAGAVDVHLARERAVRGGGGIHIGRR